MLIVSGSNFALTTSIVGLGVNNVNTFERTKIIIRIIPIVKRVLGHSDIFPPMTFFTKSDLYFTN